MDGLVKIENSSNLTGYFYESRTKCLFIEFKGGALYSYDAVPPEVVDEFEKALSKGAFLAKHIKDSYKFTKFEPQFEEARKVEDEQK